MAKQTLPGIKPHLSEDISGARLVDPPLGLTPVDAKASARLCEDWVQKARDKGQGGFVDELAAADVPLSSFLQAAFELSPYLRDLANKHPDTLAQCHNEGFDAALQDCLAAFDDAGYHAQDEAALSTSLRIAKRKAALICGLADLGGWWSWRQVSQAISDTADHAVQATVCCEAGWNNGRKGSWEERQQNLSSTPLLAVALIDTNTLLGFIITTETTTSYAIRSSIKKTIWP